METGEYVMHWFPFIMAVIVVSLLLVATFILVREDERRAKEAAKWTPPKDTAWISPSPPEYRDPGRRYCLYVKGRWPDPRDP